METQMTKFFTENNWNVTSDQRLMENCNSVSSLVAGCCSCTEKATNSVHHPKFFKVAFLGRSERFSPEKPQLS